MPKREAARQHISDSEQSFDEQLIGYRDFLTATKGWLADVRKVSDWGPAKDDVQGFLSAGDDEVVTLTAVAGSETADDANVVGANLAQEEADFVTAVALVRSDLGLSN